MANDSANPAAPAHESSSTSPKASQMLSSSSTSSAPTTASLSVASPPVMPQAASETRAAAEASSVSSLARELHSREADNRRDKQNEIAFDVPKASQSERSNALANFQKAFRRAKIGIERMKIEAAILNEERRRSVAERSQQQRSDTSGTEKLARKMSSLRERFNAGIERLKDNGTMIKNRTKDRLRYEPTLDRITNVENFFRYTEEEGKKFFDDLDGDGDGIVTVEDLKKEMRRRNLPEKYAYRRVDWDTMRELMNEREVSMLRAYRSLGLVDKKGKISKKDLRNILNKLGKDGNDENVDAMVGYLIDTSQGNSRKTNGIASTDNVIEAVNTNMSGAISTERSVSPLLHTTRQTQEEKDKKKPIISYSDFRNFVILIPPETIRSVDPSTVWFNAATIIPPIPEQTTATMTTSLVIRSAVAGGLASGTSTLALHPLDTLKTRLQATVGNKSIISIVKTAVKGGRKVLFRGSVPAVIGAACSHGTRTAIYECFKIILSTSLPFLPSVQVQGMSSAAGTFLGTGVRIPCEVLKQQLQNGNHANVMSAASSLIRADGYVALFRGTAATLAREIPFYVLGMVLYEQLKEVVKTRLGRELKVYETISVGALSGALAAAATTPADVLKTRMMTGTVSSLNVSAAALEIIHKESITALFRGVIPRMLWIAPLGAMNFAGYELAKRAMETDVAANER